MAKFESYNPNHHNNHCPGLAVVAGTNMTSFQRLLVRRMKPHSKL